MGWAPFLREMNEGSEHHRVVRNQNPILRRTALSSQGKHEVTRGDLLIREQETRRMPRLLTVVTPPRLMYRRTMPVPSSGSGWDGRL